MRRPAGRHGAGETGTLRLRRVLADASFPAYERFALEATSTAVADDYLFSDTSARFFPRAGDTLVLMPGVTLLEGVRATVRVGSSELDLGVSLEQGRQLIELLSESPKLAELQAAVPESELQTFLSASFGKILFAPSAMQPLEACVSGTEVVRFPGSPYEIDRNYWANMADARSHFRSQTLEALDVHGFKRLLRELHVLVLAGQHLDCFYFPASPAARRGVKPGQLHDASTRLTREEASYVIQQGLRVNASLIGPRHYQRALYVSVDDEASLGDELVHGAGMWGRVVLGRSPAETEPKPWFIPPRPLSDEHFARLLGILKSVPAMQQRDVIQQLALFHQRFVRVHPFRCANQSVAMTIVNSLLHDQIGTGIPHLLLDHFALRMSSDAYALLFARAVANYAYPDLSVAHRYQQLRRCRTLQYQLLNSIESSGDADARSVLDSADSEARRSALLC